jgi:hypothetical protein
MFAGLPPSSSELANGKALFRQLLLQIGGANIKKSAAAVVARRGKNASARTLYVARSAR